MSHDVQWIHKGSSWILLRSSMSKVSCLKKHNDRKEISSSFVTKEKIIFNRRPKKRKTLHKNTYYWCDLFSFVSFSGDFTGHLRFWLQKYLVQNWRELLTRKKLTVIIFRNFMTLSRWERKWKFERTVTLMGRGPKTNVYHIERGIYRVDPLKRNCIGTI